MLLQWQDELATKFGLAFDIIDRDRLAEMSSSPRSMVSREYPLWRGEEFKYEYTEGHLAIDVINGGPGLRHWVDDMAAGPESLDALARADEDDWIKERRAYLRY